MVSATPKAIATFREVTDTLMLEPTRRCHKCKTDRSLNSMRRANRVNTRFEPSLWVCKDCAAHSEAAS